MNNKIRITEVNQSNVFIIKTNESNRREYIRLSKNNWLVKNGESYEVYYDYVKLEVLLLNLLLKE